MPKIKGRLQKVERVSGWARDIRIQVDGQKLYKVIAGFGERRKLFQKAHSLLGRVVDVEYEDRDRGRSGWYIDRAIFASRGIPRKYREIIDINENGRAR